MNLVVQHLLCLRFVSRLLSPVTDSDKLAKPHEKKKRGTEVLRVNAT